MRGRGPLRETPARRRAATGSAARRPRSGGAPACVLVCLASAAACLACFQFYEPGAWPVRLDVAISVREEPRAGAVEAVLSPGLPPEEVPGPLRVGERSFAAAAGAGVEAPRYVGSWVPRREELSNGILRVEGPATAASGRRPVVRVPFLWRDGPETLPLGPAEDLRLPLHGVPESVPGLVSAGWSLRVESLGEASTVLLRLSGSGLPADTVVVPAALLAQVARRPLRIRLRASYEVDGTATDAPYPVTTRLLVEPRWSVVRP